MIKKVLFLISFSLCLISENYGQTATTGVTSSPTDASRINNQPGNGVSQGTSSNIYDVDLFSGTANVNIPIYDYSVDGLDVGVSLSYNTGGIRVDQIASCEGLGWNLNAGGYITRQVNGIEDEATIKAVNNAIEQRGSWVTAGPTNVAAHNNESDRDVFTAVFAGRTINFIVWTQDCATYQNTTPMCNRFVVGTSPKSNISVEITFGNSPAPMLYNILDTIVDNGFNILQFTITDEKGNRFLFVPGDFEYKTYYDSTINFTYTYVPTERWVLKNITTYTGQQVNYTYNSTYLTYPYYQYQEVKECLGYTLFSSPTVLPFIQIMHDSEVTWTGNFAHVAEIDYPNGTKVNFNMDNNSRRDILALYALQNIAIESKYDNTVNNKISYNFKYSYFNTDPSNPDISYYLGANNSNPYNYRLALKEIDRVGNDNTSSELYYKFGYNTTQNILPPRLSPSQDCYGYANGNSPNGLTITSLNIPVSNPPTYSHTYNANSTFNDISVPYHDFHLLLTQTNSYGTDRSDNFSYATGNILTSITNSLGGEINFYYKQHSLSNPSLGSANVNKYYTPYEYNGTSTTSTDVSPDLDYSTVNDGICIDHITVSDGYNPDNTTTTNYTFNQGYRFFMGGYFWYPTMINTGYTNQGTITWLERIYTNRFVSPIDYVNGFNHGYSDVLVKTYGYNSALISNKEYKFTNIIASQNEVDSMITPRNCTYPYRGIPDWRDAYTTASRLMCHWGLYTHTLPSLHFQKNLLGVPIETDEYDYNNNLISKTINNYNLSAACPESVPCNGCQGNEEYFTYNLVSGPSSAETVYGLYSPLSNEVAQLKKSTTYQYSAGNTMSTESDYTYDSLGNMICMSSKDSKNDTYDKTFGFIKYYIGSGYDCTNYMVGINTIWSSDKFLVLPAGELLTKSGSQIYYKGSIPYPINGYAPCFNGGEPRPLRYVNWLISTNTGPVTVNSTQAYHAKDYNVFDDHNNVLETAYNNNNKYGSSIWDTRIGQKLAEVNNAHYSEIACTSFEGNFANFGTADYNKGHWDFYPANIYLGNSSDPALTGRYYYSLSTSSTVSSTISPASGKNYLLSFWAKGSVSPIVTTTLVSNNLNAPYNIPITSQIQVNNWTLYTAYFQGTGYPLTISMPSSQTAKIDELRLLPADASMDTYTYEPLLGVSSHCDERNNILYYEYDAQGRPTVVRDINGNILSLTKHVNQGNDN